MTPKNTWCLYLFLNIQKGIYILNYTKLNATIFVYCVKFYYLCI